MGYVNQVLTEYGRNAGAISQSYVDEVCKHAHEMKLYCFRSLSTEHEPSTAILEEVCLGDIKTSILDFFNLLLSQVMAEFFEEHEIQNFGLYIALRAVDHFFGYCFFFFQNFCQRQTFSQFTFQTQAPPTLPRRT